MKTVTKKAVTQRARRKLAHSAQHLIIPRDQESKSYNGEFWVCCSKTQAYLRGYNDASDMADDLDLLKPGETIT